MPQRQGQLTGKSAHLCDVAEALVQAPPHAVIGRPFGTQEVDVDAFALALAVGPVLRLLHPGHLRRQLSKHDDAGTAEIQSHACTGSHQGEELLRLSLWWNGGDASAKSNGRNCWVRKQFKCHVITSS